jgi:hypothetical protein
MNLKVKSSLIIIFTLIIGMLLGGVVVATFLKKDGMRDRIAAMRKPDGFSRRFERIIEPDSSQQEIIREILGKHFNRVKKTSHSLRMELEPILTKEQKERLIQRLGKIHRWGPKPGEFPRPPFDENRRPNR